MRVLVVEDEDAIANAIERGLIKQGYAVDIAHDGAEALDKATVNNYDVICLDLNLPRVDGLEVCRRLREDRFGGGIIMLTARSSIKERIEGLDYGADDYLVKPFAMKELVARVRAAARRGVRPPEQHRLEPVELEGLVIDPRNVQAYVDGTSAGLTPTEFKLLHTLALEQGRVVTRDELMQRIWGRRQRYRDRTVDVFVRKLRDKIDRRSTSHDFIHTRHGVGYKLEAQAKP
jgi:DNA-binding response OmpR family regulator